MERVERRTEMPRVMHEHPIYQSETERQEAMQRVLEQILSILEDNDAY
jgi:transcriptional regulator of NAD metabolism